MKIAAFLFASIFASIFAAERAGAQTEDPKPSTAIPQQQTPPPEANPFYVPPSTGPRWEEITPPKPPAKIARRVIRLEDEPLVAGGSTEVRPVYSDTRAEPKAKSKPVLVAHKPEPPAVKLAEAEAQPPSQDEVTPESVGLPADPPPPAKPTAQAKQVPKTKQAQIKAPALPAKAQLARTEPRPQPKAVSKAAPAAKPQVKLARTEAPVKPKVVAITTKPAPVQARAEPKVEPRVVVKPVQVARAKPKAAAKPVQMAARAEPKAVAQPVQLAKAEQAVPAKIKKDADIATIVNVSMHVPMDESASPKPVVATPRPSAEAREEPKVEQRQSSPAYHDDRNRGSGNDRSYRDDNNNRDSYPQTSYPQNQARASYGRPLQGNNIRQFNRYDLDAWQEGRWLHVRRDGQYGWWWVVGSNWYLYPAPVYPYPNPYVPPMRLDEQTRTDDGDYWYYCRSSRNYYPYVSECNSGWVSVPTDPRKIARRF